jgi:hypothetical protein
MAHEANEKIRENSVVNQIFGPNANSTPDTIDGISNVQIDQIVQIYSFGVSSGMGYRNMSLKCMCVRISVSVG